MKLLLLIPLLLVLTACDDDENPPAGYRCDNRWSLCKPEFWVKDICDKEALASFIIECAKAANPMSDEEGEDLVQQCEWTGMRLYCEQEFYKPTTGSHE